MLIVAEVELQTPNANPPQRHTPVVRVVSRHDSNPDDALAGLLQPPVTEIIPRIARYVGATLDDTVDIPLSPRELFELEQRLVNLRSEFYRDYIRDRLNANPRAAINELMRGYTTFLQSNQRGELLYTTATLNHLFKRELIGAHLLKDQVLAFDIEIPADTKIAVEWRYDSDLGWKISTLNGWSAFLELPLVPPLTSEENRSLSFWRRVRLLQEARELSDDQIARALSVKPYQYRAYLKADCDSTKKSPENVPRLSDLLLVSPYVLCGSTAADCKALSWNEQVRLRRIRQGLNHQSLVDRIKKVEMGFSTAKDAPMIAQLLRYETGSFVPPGDMQRALSLILEIPRGAFPAPRRDKTGIHRTVDEQIERRLLNFFNASDSSDSGMPVDGNPVEFEATPGVTKRIGDLSLFIPELTSQDTRTFLLVARTYPLIGTGLALHARDLQRTQEEDLKKLPLRVFVRKEANIVSVRLSAFYVLEALRNNRHIPLELAVTTARLSVTPDGIHRFNIEAGVASRVLTINRDVARRRGLKDGDHLVIKAEELPTGDLAVALYALGSDYADEHIATVERSSLITVYKARDLRIKGRKASAPVVRARAPVCSKDTAWLQDLASVDGETQSYERRGQLWLAMWSEDERGQAAYEQLAKSFYPVIEHAVASTAHALNSEFADQLRSTGVLLMVKALRDFEKGEADTAHSVGERLSESVAALVRRHILSQTYELLRSTGFISLDAPISASPGSAHWIDQISAQGALERMGWGQTDEDFGSLQEFICEEQAREISLQRIPAAYAIRDALRQNSVLRAVAHRDRMGAEELDTLATELTPYLKLSEVDEHSSFINLFSLLQAMAAARVTLDSLAFHRTGRHTWRASTEYSRDDPNCKLLSQLRDVVSEIDEVC